MSDDTKQPFMSHLEELRGRLVACAIAVGVGFAGAYFFCEQLFQVLVSPLKDVLPEGEKLIYTSLPEMFFTYLKVSLVAGVMAAAPYIFYQIWMFVAPGLYRNERRLLVPFVIVSTFLFVGGALFGYFVVFPFGFKFFIGFSNDLVRALPSVKQYFSFSIKLLFAFGAVFELPVIIFFLAKMGIVTPKMLKHQRKYAILMTFVVAAILTPPDVVTQLMMAGPLIVLYEISIIVAGFARVSKKQDDETEDKDDEGKEG